MDFEFTIKLTQDELDQILVALEAQPLGEVLQVTKKIAHQVSEQGDDAAEFEFDMQLAARDWKPSPRKTMSLDEALEELQKHVKPQDETLEKKPHWTHTPEGKKKMAARSRRGKKV